jgi:hypothetical protein
MIGWILWWMLGCGGPAERIARLEASLDQWEEGVQALETGNPLAAVAAFSKAILKDPASPELWLWKGRALAEGGDLEGAIEAAGQVLVRRPDHPLARYNRACWLARLGRLEEAARDLSRVLEEGGVDRLTAARDPDLDVLRADPTTRSRVPPRRLPAWATADSEAMFVGSQWSVRILVELPVDEPSLHLSFDGNETAPLELMRIVEDRVPHGAIVERNIEFIFRVLGEGEGRVGPWMARGAGLEAFLPTVPYRFLAPPGTSPVVGRSLAGLFRSPEERVGALQGTGALRLEDRVVVRGEPGDRLEASAPPSLHVEVRQGGQPSWIAWELASEPGSRVAVHRSGALVYEGTP